MAAQVSESDQIKQVMTKGPPPQRRLVVNWTFSLLTLQFKEFLGTYNKVTENCFVDCVKDFTSRDVKPEEVNRKWVLLSGLWLADRRVTMLRRCDVTSSWLSDQSAVSSGP